MKKIFQPFVNLLERIKRLFQRKERVYKKPSLLDVWEARRKTKILATLTLLLIAALLVQNLVLKNPKKSQASISLSGDTLTVSGGQFLVDEGGNILTLTEPNGTLSVNGILKDTTINMDSGRDVVVTNGATLAFMGGNQNLLNLTVTGSGSKVTHLGPGTAANNLTMGKNYFGVKIDGWLKAPATANSYGIYCVADDGYRLDVWDINGNKINTFLAWGTHPAFQYTLGAYYRYQISYIEAGGDATVSLMHNGNSFDENNTWADMNGGVPNAATVKQAYTTYYFPSNKQDIIDARSGGIRLPDDTSFYKVFDISNIKSPRFIQSFTTGVPGFWWGGNAPANSSWQTNTSVNRQLNLNLSGNLTINSGGAIDVTGRGYSGGENCIDGSGTGGGSGDGSNGGGGGGYGGSGGNGARHMSDDYAIPGRGGKTYGSSTNPIDLGSGGGCGGGFSGGAGGGLVIVAANEIITENANAVIANGEQLPRGFKGGGGSGGTINFTTQTMDVAGSSKVFFSDGGYGGNDGNSDNLGQDNTDPGAAGGGGRVAINYNKISSASDLNDLVSVEPGWPNPTVRSLTRATFNTSYWGFLIGEQGTIYISNTGTAQNNIKKELIPVHRGSYSGDFDLTCDINTSNLDNITVASKPGKNCNNNFNPYALQLNDFIIVKMTVSNLIVGQQITVKDEWLKLPNNSSTACKPSWGGSAWPGWGESFPWSWGANGHGLDVIGSYGGAGNEANVFDDVNYNIPVTWKTTPTDPVIKFSYLCKVTDQ